jgi:hypothetical protein
LQNPVQQAAEMDRNGLTMGLGTKAKTAFFGSPPRISNSCENKELENMGDTGLEPVTLRV